MKLSKFSIKGPDLAKGTDTVSKGLVALLTSYGKTPNDLSLAFASDPTRKLDVTFGAYRIKGVNASDWTPKLYDLFVNKSTATATKINIGGKDVTKVVQESTKVVTYAWDRGDILFFVNTATEALAADAVAALP